MGPWSVHLEERGPVIAIARVLETELDSPVHQFGVSIGPAR